MASYIIQSSDNQQYALTTAHINQYPLLRDTLTDIVVEPGTITNIPFPGDLLMIVFNNNYNQLLNLDKLVELINLVAYLGLENKADNLLWTLSAYLRQKFTSQQVVYIKNLIDQLQLFLIRLFVDKIVTVDYSSSFIVVHDPESVESIFAKIQITDPDLYNVITERTIWIRGDPDDTNINYSLWRKNMKSVIKLDDVVVGSNIVYLSPGTDFEAYYLDENYIYEENKEPKLIGYEIFSVLLDEDNELLHNTISLPDYTQSSVDEIKISIDLTKYMILYYSSIDQPLKRKMFVGLVDDPQQIVSLDIGLDYYLSNLFDTIISVDNDSSYTIYNIQYPNVVSNSVNFPTNKEPGSSVKFYLSYDGKMIAEVIDDLNLRILNSKGQLITQKEMLDDEHIKAITNKLLITYNISMDELRLWDISGLSEDGSPSAKLIPPLPLNRDKPTDVHAVEVILGKDNSFLLTRETIYGYDEDAFKEFEWTKYTFGYKDDINKFYISLIQK